MTELASYLRSVSHVMRSVAPAGVVRPQVTATPALPASDPVRRPRLVVQPGRPANRRLVAHARRKRLLALLDGLHVDSSGTQGASAPPQWTVGAGVVSLALLVIGLLGAATGSGAMRSLALLFFCFVGIGSAVVGLRRVTLPAFLALSILISLIVLIIGGAVMATLPFWHPFVVFAVLAAAVTFQHVQVLRRAWKVQPRSPAAIIADRLQRLLRLVRRPMSASLMCSIVGTASWLVGALENRHLTPQVGGFLPQMPLIWYAGLLLVLAGVMLSRRDREYEAAIAVTLLMLALTVTPSLVYDTPRITSAAKHVGVINQIIDQHRVYPHVNIYNSWPGFFGAMAWVCDVARIRDPMTLALWWPPLIGLWRLVALRYLCGKVFGSGYRCWVATALAILADTIGSDYFSPQSVGFVIALCVFALALRMEPVRPFDLRLRIGLIFIAGWALAMTHQLSPYLLGGGLIALVVFRLVRNWWTPLLILGPAVLWAVLHKEMLRGFVSLAAIGRIGNFRPPHTPGSVGLVRQPIVHETVLALVTGIAIIGVLALLALATTRGSRMKMLGLGSCAAVAVLSVGANPYGQEALFRAMLFAIPWLAMMAAQFPVNAERARTAIFAVSAPVMLTTFLVASFGLDASNVMRPGDLAAFRYFENTAPAYSEVIELGGGDLPVWPTARYRFYTYVSRADKDLKYPVQQYRVYDATRDVALLTERLATYAYGADAARAGGRHPGGHPGDLYAIWSPASMYFDWEYATQSKAQFQALRDALIQSPYWSVTFQTDGTYLFRLLTLPPAKQLLRESPQ